MHAAPPPSPRRISTKILTNPQQLIFSWDQALEYVCPTLEYNFTSQSCGTCATKFNTSRAVSCTEFQTSPAGINCTFTVWSIVCGNVTGPGSMQSANVTLQGYNYGIHTPKFPCIFMFTMHAVPNAPTVQSLPRYQDGRIQILIGLMTTFPIVVRLAAYFRFNQWTISPINSYN